MKTTFANLSKHHQKHEYTLIKHKKKHEKLLKTNINMKTPQKKILDIKTPKNHPKSNVTKPNFSHPWQEGHAKITHKNPKTPFKNL